MQVDRRKLHTALKELSKVARFKIASPILRNVLLRHRGDTLALTATDLTTRLSCCLPADGPEFETCLPAKTLAALVKPEGRADAGTVEIRPSQNSKRTTIMVDGLTTQLPSQNPADFPATIADPPALEWSALDTMNARALRDSLNHVLPSASKDPTREHLNTILLDHEHLVATDGHRLHLAPLPTTIRTTILLPVTAAKTLHRLLSCDGDARLSLAKDILRAQVGCWQLDVKLPDKEFPPYRQVIPDYEAQPTRICLDTEVFAKALARIARVSESKRIRMHVNGVLTLQSWSADDATAEIQVPTIHSNHQGDDLITGCDLAYLQDAMRTAGPQVQMGFSGQLDPLRVDTGDRLAVIMPLRL